jgi:alkylhydroperoxidase family enzyme
MTRARITPVSAGDAVRARVPAVLVSQRENVAAALGDGLVERRLKDLCARYLADDDEVVAHAGDPERFTARERAALAWAHAVAWDSDRASEQLWSELHRHFEEAELVELGYAIAFTMGQQRWLATLGLEN